MGHPVYFTHDLQNILYYSVVFDIMIDLFATVMLPAASLIPLTIRDRRVGKSTVMHVPQIVCVLASTVNMPKCKQQVTELLLHMITIKF